MSKIALSDVLDLSVSKRIQLVEDIWDSIAAIPECPKHADAQRAELDRRLETHRKNPSAGSLWKDVKKRIVGRA